MANVNEQWRVVKENPDYLISNFGKFKNKKTNKHRRFFLNPKSGYFQVAFRQNGSKSDSSKYIHRMVAEAFLEKSSNSKANIVNHKNRIKTDNSLKNLEWVTPKENIDHAVRTEKQQISVISYNMDSKEIRCFKSMAEAARELKLNLSSVSQVINKKIRQTHGYYFELDNDAETITSGKPDCETHYSKSICLECGKEFDKVIHNKKFCSTICTSKYSAKNASPNCVCSQCKKPLHRRPYYLKTNKNVFCSTKCNSEFRIASGSKKTLPVFEKIKPLVDKLNEDEKDKLIHYIYDSMEANHKKSL